MQPWIDRLASKPLPWWLERFALVVERGTYRFVLVVGFALFAGAGFLLGRYLIGPITGTLVALVVVGLLIAGLRLSRVFPHSQH